MFTDFAFSRFSKRFPISRPGRKTMTNSRPFFSVFQFVGGLSVALAMPVMNIPKANKMVTRYILVSQHLPCQPAGQLHPVAWGEPLLWQNLLQACERVAGPGHPLLATQDWHSPRLKKEKRKRLIFYQWKPGVAA